MLYKEFSISGGLLEQLALKGGRLVRQNEVVKAVNGVNLQVNRGEALCVVGESGCGKSTVARCVMGLLSPTAGAISYDGQRIDKLSNRQWLPFRRNITVHCLGGCVLAEHPSRGVVSSARESFGEVFGYRNLSVADGAIVPVAVGANPSATIAALSEMVAERITGIAPTADL